MSKVLALIGMTLLIGGAIRAAEPDPAVDASKLRNAAQLNPGDDAALTGLWDSLPKSGNYAVVEGDLLLTREELRAWLKQDRSIRRVRPTVGPELLLNIRADGGDDYYQKMSERVLTYWIDPQGFAVTELTELREKLDAAAKEWEGVCPECGIDFVEKEAKPAFFVVQRVQGQPYVAAAFFPHWPQARRLLRIDSSWFSAKPAELRTGVLRHELGHVLGYRHEHIRNVPGCYQEGNDWKALTRYDKSSVMHYFCGGGGNKVLALSKNDKEGHRKQYKPAPGPAAMVLPDSEAQTAARTLWEQAIREAAETDRKLQEDPDHVAARPALAALFQSLPATKKQGIRVMDGDMRVSEYQLKALLSAASSTPKPLVDGPELIVNMAGTERDYYRKEADRRLRYRIDRESFGGDNAAYQAALKWMRAAGSAWEEICENCGIEFIHAFALDADPKAKDEAPANFVVEKVDDGSYLAAAFFPHEGKAHRFLSVDTSLLTTDLGDPKKTENFQIGVIKHELGHILGYRHEHTRKVPGCYYEDNEWEALTKYDKASVMHYPCGGGGNPAGPDITATDIEGHRNLYAPKAKKTASDSAPPTALLVRLQGDDVSQNAARVLSELYDAKLVPTTNYTVVPGDTIETIYQRVLGIRGQSTVMTMLAQKINRRKNLDTLMPGETIIVPDLSFDTFEFTRSFPVRTPEEQQRVDWLKSQWNYLGGEQTPVSWGTPTPTFTNLKFTGFELTLESSLTEKLEKLAARLRELEPANVLVSIPTAKLTEFHSLVTWEQAQVTSKFPKGEGNEIDLGALVNRKPAKANDLCGVPFAEGPWTSTAKPEVVLIDEKFYKHPDLENAIHGESIDAVGDAIVDDTHQYLRAVPFNKADHGTHMAGIIGARENGFGIIGMDKAAKISTIVWQDSDANNEKRVANAISQKINDRTEPQIFVFALSWGHKPAPKNVNERYATSLLSRIILDNLGSLWVVAAGNEDRELTTLTDIGPMNLGDRPNVIVVTACEECFDRGRLIRKANRSPNERVVHVAAPGVTIPSTSLGSNYSATDGTSPAAAFAGGLASAMVRRWPYGDGPAGVKRRMMLTSRPSLGEAAWNDLSFGVLDAEAALLDPSRHWLQRYSERRHIPADNISWALSRIVFEDFASGRPKTFNTPEIHRIVRRGPDPPGDPAAPQTWVVYYLDNEDILRKSKPLVATSLNTSIVSLKYDCGGEEKRTELALKDVDDILLARAVGLEGR